MSRPNPDHMPHTLHADVKRGLTFMNEHRATTALGTVTLLAMTFGAGTAIENIERDNTCIASDETITAQSGDTLWDITKTTGASDDGRTRIDHALSLPENSHLAAPGRALQPGDVITLPICGDDIVQD